MAAGEIVTAISFLGDQSETAAPFTQAVADEVGNPQKCFVLLQS